MPFGAINAYPNYIGGSEHITELRAYLNTTCHHKGIGELWISTFHTFFREKRPDFELIFLYQMLHRRTYRRWNLDVDARRCLCLCGYEYIKRLPPEEFDWNEPTIETMISRTVIRTAIEDSIFTLPEQDAPFREALMVYLFVEDINNLSLMLYTNPDYWMQSIAQDPARDAAFRDVLADCMRRILVDKESPFPAKRMDHMRNKIGSLSIFLSEEQKRYGWTANSKETIEKNLKCQVDGIVTDDPELVMHYAMQTWHRRLLSLFVRNFFAP